MHFTTLALAALYTTASAVSAASLRETCGDGRVISVSTIPFKDGDVTVTETECPGFAAISGVKERAEPERRDVAQCTNGGCSILCQSTGNQPFISSCNSLTDALESHYPNEFVVNPNTMVIFNYSSCAYGFGNLDTVPYDVCYLNFGYNGAITADQCFGDWPAPTATSGGYCLSPQTPSNMWGIEVFNPI
ncbi:hypothetical protein BS17DRAFT_880764 [Gyrodon lividus]|nr:hypothetical protein BS17DRAFT_880764 [Gyrodon lividus]